MTSLIEIPIFLHIATIGWGLCIHMLTKEAFASRRFTMPVSTEDPRRRRARHRITSILVAVLAALALLTFISAFLPDEMRRSLWPV